MLEKYQENFDAKEFIKSYAAQKKTTQEEALKICRNQIPQESYFQTKIKNRLKKQYPDAFVRKISQGNYSEAGMPDICCIVQGHYFGFEVKRPLLGRASEIQKATIQQIRKAGGTAEIVCWPEEAIQFVDEYLKDIQKRAGMI